ncbi:MAG: endolytic transglycosylase MltG [Bacteroidota bacterium]
MKLIKKLLILLLIGIAIVGGIASWLYSSLNEPIAHDKNEEYIVIERGSSPNKIVEILENENIIQSDLALKLYFRFLNRNPQLQAGDYLFPSPISPMEAINVLKKGKKRTENFTVPEGWTRFDIAERITKQFPSEPPLSKADILEMMEDTHLIQDIDATATNLEGYLYPSTYQFEEGTSAEQVIKKMVQQFKAIWQPEWDALAQKMGRSKREIVTIASLIENESKIDAERPIVASVIYNRLEQGIPLGIDATNVYIAKLQGRWDGIIHKSDVEVDHPYNTRKISGLPPGPISSPSKSAIQAALNPAQTDYLYYVLNVEKNDGSHHFYATSAGFFKGKRDYQKWLREQRGR